ncbi:MAG: rhomboid family intramembrane serine protease [Spirochaetales bacterium]|nr:rhomboid family intramembrane serine protease [Spirochaetales bacterium]
MGDEFDNETKYSLFSLKEEPSRKEKILGYMKSNKFLNLYVKFPMTMIFITVNVVMAIVSGIMSRDLMSFSSLVLYRLGAMQSGAIVNDNEFYRFFTSSILHGGIVHLAFNMYALFFLGQMVEKIEGKVRFAVVYIFSALVASSFTFMSGYMGIGIGASGCVFAIFGYFFVIIAYKVYKRVIPASILVRFSIMLGINIAIGFTVPNIDNAAHLGGFVSGVFSGVFFFLVDKSGYSFLKKIAPVIVALLFITAPVFAFLNASKDENFPRFNFTAAVEFQESFDDIIKFVNKDYPKSSVPENIEVGKRYVEILDAYMLSTSGKERQQLELIREAVMVENEILAQGETLELIEKRASIIEEYNKFN